VFGVSIGDERDFHDGEFLQRYEKILDKKRPDRSGLSQ
jgi:hypothetical protein